MPEGVKHTLCFYFTGRVLFVMAYSAVLSVFAGEAWGGGSLSQGIRGELKRRNWT